MRWSAEQQREAEALGLTLYDKPLPPARGPVTGRDGLELRFKDERARAAFQADCAAQVGANCLRGATAACALKAARHCAAPAWLRWLGLGGTGKSWQETEACQAAYAAECEAAAAGGCEAHAQSFCSLVVERDRRR